MKLSEDKDEAATATIHERVTSGRYNTIQEFLSDIEKASSAVIEKKQSQGAIANGPPVEGVPLTEVVNRIAAFKKILNSLLRQASFGTKYDIKAEPSEDGAEAPAKSSVSNVDTRDDKLALTFFGNPSNPKQLYSSLQKSLKVPLPSSETGTQKCVEVQAPLREIALPNGITATKVVTYNLEAAPKERRTFGEVFAPRPSLPQLEPPRKARPPTRNWIDPFDAATDIKSFPGEWSNYSLASLPSGLWLQYGGTTSSPSYWSRRQKQQSPKHYGDGDAAQLYPEDPTLWTEDDPTPIQGVYSSFAPSFDSSGAIMQEDSKDMVWWGTRGAKRLDTLLSLQHYEDFEDGSTVQTGIVGKLDESSLEEAVKAFNPEDSADEVARIDASKDQASKGMDDILGEISELLETLSSYQRIRNLDIPVAGNQGPKATQLGTPSTPSTTEQSVYETLKSSLVTIVSTLPPYAVAKLDGDQLAELNISQKILVESPDYRGTMEKDDFTIQQERAAAAVAQGAMGAGRTSTPSASRSRSYHGSQSGYNQRVYAANSRVQQAQQYYGGRQPAASGPYSPGIPQHYSGAAAPGTPSQRPSYIAPYSTSQYAAQNGYNPYAAQQGPPPAQASPQPYAARAAPPYNTSFAGARSATPQKQPAYGTQPRTPYMTPGPNNPQQRYLAQQQKPTQYANYPSNQAPAPSTPYANPATAATYARSAAEQTALMDRNKAQLAAAQSRRGSSTPQPGVSRQQSQTSEQDRSATPSRKRNGTPVPA